MAINRSLMNRQMYFLGSSPYGNMGGGLYNTQYGLPQSMVNYLNQSLPGQSSSGNAIYPRLDQLNSGVSSAEQELQQINQSIDQVQSTLGESSGGPSSGNNGFSFPIERGFGVISSGEPTLAKKDTYISGQNSGQPFNPGGDINSILGDYRNSDFFSRFGTADVRPFTFGGKEMSGSSTYISGLKNYLDSIGKSDLFGGYNDIVAPLGQSLGSSPMSSAMRSMAASGGIMNAVPRENYGLGSFVKKAVKGVKSAVSGAVDAVKDVAKSDLGKAALLTAGAYYAPAMFGGTAGFGPGSTYRQFLGGLSPFAVPGTGTSFGGSAYGLGEAIRGGLTSIIPKSTAGKFALGTAAIGGLTGFLASQGMEEEEIEAVKRNPTALRGYLAQYYSNLNPKANPREVDAFVERNMSEYSTSFATGGRAGYAFGSPEENAKQASGVMGLPLNQNPAGVTELDLRETGGFIPPVGVKEKADDIPAMLSNNEFVFTADAVRGMGDGDVNKGAQRMYDMMKKLENGGRV